jgi:hypothetical protein
MKKIEIWANYSDSSIIEMIKLFEERGYEINKIWSASSIPIVVTKSNIFSGYGNIITLFRLHD